MSADSPTKGPIDWRRYVRPVVGETAGRATIGPADLPVVDVLRRLAAGATDLDPAEVRACLNYAADVLAAAPAPPIEFATLPPTADPAAPVTLPPASVHGNSHHVHGYDILGELGRGGMGVVYKARQLGLNRIVALKMILAGGHAGAKERARFRAEAEAVARLQHPNIVQVHEVGEHDGLPYFSLEFVAGGALATQLDGKPWPAKRAAEFIETLAGAVHAAHQAGVIHRDLKPANVLIGAAGTPKIADFGLAKRLESEGPTLTGEVMGTPEYMSPEQASGRKDVGPATDVWALGALLYELLTGRPPFRGQTPLDTILQVLERELAPVRNLNRGAGRDLETVCWKCLQKAPTQRYADAAELAADLRRFLDGEPIRAKAPSLWRRLNHRIKQVPETTSLGGVIVFFVVATFALSRAEYTICACAALLTLTATARVAVRPVFIGTIIGAAGVGAFLLAAFALVPVQPLLGFPLWAYCLIPPVFGLAVGVWRREKGIALFAYEIPVVLLAYSFILQLGDYDRITQNLGLMAFAILLGLYFGVLGRIVARWTDGPVASAVFGAIGGLLIGLAVMAVVSVTWFSLGKQTAASEWLLWLVNVPCMLLGTIVGAYLGARRKRRRSA